MKNNTENFESKEEQRREQKHLKAYLRGHKTFNFGFTKDQYGNKIPNVLNVQELLTNK